MNNDVNDKLKFIIKYDYLYILRKYMSINKFFNNDSINSNNTDNKEIKTIATVKKTLSNKTIQKKSPRTPVGFFKKLTRKFRRTPSSVPVSNGTTGITDIKKNNATQKKRGLFSGFTKFLRKK